MSKPLNVRAGRSQAVQYGLIGLAAALLGTMTLGFRAPDKTSSGAFTAEVVKADLAVEVELSGSFVAENKDEIRMEPKTYKGDLIITMLKAEGATVKKGDVLMEFDPSSLERSLEDAQNEVADKKIELDKATADLEAFKVEQDAALQQNEKQVEMARSELEKAREEAQLELEDKERSIKDAEESLADGQVDFDQLTKLYEERELHTATENILIARERRRIRNLVRSLEKTRRQVDIWKRYDQYKTINEKDLDVIKQTAELKKTQIKLDADRGEKEAGATKAQRALDKSSREASELGEDATALRVTAPRDGIVFFGTIGGDSMSDMIIFSGGDREKEMRIGGRVRTHQILMTVASMDRLSVSMRVLENDIQHMKAGLPITIRPDAFPSLTIKGNLTEVDQIASRTGFLSEVRQFPVKGEYEGIFKQLRSGMNCRVTVHADKIPEAVQVPVLAVFTEGGEFYCLAKEGSKSTRRPVKLGATNGSMVQITEGLRPGETVALWDSNED